MTTATKSKDLKKDQQIKDTKRAEELIKAYGNLVNNEAALKAELNERLKPIKEVYDGRLKSLKASIEEAEKELTDIGKRQRNTMFSVEGNWHFDNGFYLHVGTETVPLFGESRSEEPGDDFNLSKFVRQFGEYVELKFKINPLKKLFLNGNSIDRKKMVEMNFDLGTKETIEVKQSKKEKE